MSDGQLESSGQRWEARARVDYPLHFLIWLHEHKLLDEKLHTINLSEGSTSQVNFTYFKNIDLILIFL